MVLHPAAPAELYNLLIVHPAANNAIPKVSSAASSGTQMSKLIFDDQKNQLNQLDLSTTIPINVQYNLQIFV